MKTRQEMFEIYIECYPTYSILIIESLIDCYYDGFRDAIELKDKK